MKKILCVMTVLCLTTAVFARPASKKGTPRTDVKKTGPMPRKKLAKQVKTPPESRKRECLKWCQKQYKDDTKSCSVKKGREERECKKVAHSRNQECTKSCK